MNKPRDGHNRQWVLVAAIAFAGLAATQSYPCYTKVPVLCHEATMSACVYDPEKKMYVIYSTDAVYGERCSEYVDGMGYYDCYEYVANCCGPTVKTYYQDSNCTEIQEIKEGTWCWGTTTIVSLGEPGCWSQ